MAKVLLETNVVLDYLCVTRPCHAQAIELLYSVLESLDGVLVVSVSSLKDAYYIMCRYYHDESIVRGRLHDFLGIIELEELTRPVVEAAFANSPIPAMDVAAYLER